MCMSYRNSRSYGFKYEQHTPTQDELDAVNPDLWVEYDEAEVQHLTEQRLLMKIILPFYK